VVARDERGLAVEQRGCQCLGRSVCVVFCAGYHENWCGDGRERRDGGVDRRVDRRVQHSEKRLRIPSDASEVLLGCQFGGVWREGPQVREEMAEVPAPTGGVDDLVQADTGDDGSIGCDTTDRITVLPPSE
jgi:hypothetical protein